MYREKVIEIYNLIKGNCFDLTCEKIVQDQIFDLIKSNFHVEKEKRLSSKSIVDFFIDNELVVEVKIKGSATQIYRQCQRYCDYGNVKALLLITSKSMGFPQEINSKDCYYINLSRLQL